ncbi:hypothetical protein GA0070611_2372 [Micromonospora auratinigra]|uniref:Uncharacterized protein n=2 Tax=Micromonospora auratinigra TaxID=261654 RepID=A0A1A8ZI76_9ACTN|nr:hypothetical protein GA0070611_2372 [Micromonospora auratinigra]
MIDESSRQVRQFVCPCCDTDADRTWATIHRDGTALAVYFASCYHHHGIHEVWIDAILGSWGQDRFDDHLTFGCRVGPVDDSPMPAATLVNGGEVAGDSPIFGRKLSREDGLRHPRLPEFWQVVDLILEQDDLVHRHLYGPAAPHGG